MSPAPDLTIFICCRDRPRSLEITLEHLVRADTGGADIEVVVVVAGGAPDVIAAAEAFRGRLPLRCLVEERPVKGHALNRALDAGGIGRVFACLDDDMSPREDWITGVLAACERHPDCDVFAGRGVIEWPGPGVPAWALSPAIQGFTYSVYDASLGDEDAPFGPGIYPSGNNFWVRSRVFDDGLRFEPLWLGEADLCLSLTRAGRRGVVAGGAVAGHRVQPELLDPAVVRARAVRFGRASAQLELRHSPDARQFRIYRRNPAAARLLWFARMARASLKYAATYLPGAQARRFPARILALAEIANNHEKLSRVRARGARFRSTSDPDSDDS